ncbi:nitroreductase family deazaflavin-dependent oxidoreductase [Nocardia sp. CDC153]|uniref:nitroreductase family deazaflavin-dependent oxidoreductase n=1 Tax=Nocardia sp. CDC153 TaxID=3112167 RepID=UPI002DBCBBBF|nr:nitroreductase family deazaflavin-dependent oxidoreductase [Nocardia sp. CDC153]MEC3953255.1 nitroreductase family deazaflavin-dependent oxidoreductase [Nocardia sp. CDC153]
MTAPTLTSRIGARALRTRWVVRAPITLYRIGLGFLFGTRLLMLEHTGRHTGQPRYVVLEVVDHPTPDHYIVVSGFGPTAQWYRNITTHPTVHLSIGLHRRLPALATPMTDNESAQALAHYINHHPKAWTKLRTTIEAATNTPVNLLPMVRLSLTRSNTD